MPFLSKTISNLFNGVSQQPTSLRLDSQCELQENALSSLTEGLRKRPPSVHIAKLASGPVGNVCHHFINRDAVERYVVQFGNGTCRVWDLAGNEKVVNFPNGVGYLLSADPENDFVPLTVADYTFLVNRSYVTTASLVAAAARTDEYVVNVRQGNYGSDYQLYSNGVRIAEKYTSNTDIQDIRTTAIAEYLRKQMKVGISGGYLQDTDNDPNTPPVLTGGTISAAITNQGTGFATAPTVAFAAPPSGVTALGFATLGTGATVDKVVSITVTNPGMGYLTAPLISFAGGGGSGAAALATLLPSVPTLPAGVTVTRNGNVLWIQNAVGQPALNITASDTLGGSALTVTGTTIQKFTDLPLIAPNGIVIKVLGSTNTDADDYYVKFTVTGNGNPNFDTGVWSECAKPLVTNSALTKMPSILVREANGTFTFKDAPWGIRVAGDDVSAPVPSFIGGLIQDVFLFKGRLGFISGSNVSLSEVGSYFNFFRTTVQALLDSDPIDVSASSNTVSTLKAGIPFSDTLLLFADQVQFTLTSTETLSPKTAAITLATAFDCNLKAKPIVVGKNAYFGATKGAYAGLKEYATDRITNTFDAQDITKHIPKYIPGVLRKVAKSTNEDLMIVLSDGDRAKLYPYKYYFDGEQKLQSSWSTFAWSETDPAFAIITCEFIGSDLYLTIQRTEGVFLEKLNFSAGVTEANTTAQLYNTLIDRKAFATVKSYNALANTTTIGFPYTITGVPMAVTYADGVTTTQAGQVLTALSSTGTSITVYGDLSAKAILVGQSYLMRWKPSEPVIRDSGAGGNQNVVTTARLQTRAVTASVVNSGFFSVLVTPLNRDTYTTVWSGTQVAGVTALLGAPHISNGKIKARCEAKSNELSVEFQNATHLPSNLTAIEWEFLYVIKSRRA